jgi:hypothetical protein
MTNRSPWHETSWSTTFPNVVPDYPFEVETFSFESAMDTLYDRGGGGGGGGGMEAY